MAIHEAARAQGLTMSEWVRAAIRIARRQRSCGDADQKVAAIRTAAAHAFPTGEVETMLADISAGYDAG